MKKIILVLICVCMAAIAANAQKFDLSVETEFNDFKSNEKRSLIVELLDENALAIGKLSKLLKANPKAVENYRTFIKTYNENIQKAVAKHWSLNATIEYKSTKEVKKLIDAKDRKTLILTAAEQGGGESYITRLEGTATLLMLYRTEKGASNPDYKIFLPYSYSRYNQANPLSDYMFTVQMAVRNISYMLNKKTNSTAFDFMETEAMENCKFLEKKTLYIDDALLSNNADKEGIKKYFEIAKFKVAKTDDMGGIIEAADAENCYTVLIPYSTFSNPLGREKTTYLLCYKLIVNAADGKILNFMEGKAKASPDVSQFQEKDFKDLNECSF